MHDFAGMTGRLKDTAYTRQGIMFIRKFAIYFKSSGIGPQFSDLLQQVKQDRQQLGDTVSARLADSAIQAIKTAK
jgi:hypothetical protein